MTDQLAEISKVVDLSNVYIIVGILVVFNLGTIATVLYTAAKIVWWVSKLDSRVGQNEKDVKIAYKDLREQRTLILILESKVNGSNV